MRVYATRNISVVLIALCYSNKKGFSLNYALVIKINAPLYFQGFLGKGMLSLSLAGETMSPLFSENNIKVKKAT